MRERKHLLEVTFLFAVSVHLFYYVSKGKERKKKKKMQGPEGNNSF
jgi:hypothetical protein